MAIRDRWDSSDPARHPPPLPLNPGVPGSPRTIGQIQSPFLSGTQTQSREVSPIRRPPRETSPPNGGGSPGNNVTLTRPQQVISSHRRMQSMQPTPSVREMGNMLLNGPPPVPGHSNRNSTPTPTSTPTPKELFGSQTSFPTLRETASQGNLPSARDTASPEKNFPPLRESASQGNFPALRESLTTPGYRGSLDFDRAPSLLPPLRSFKSPEGSPPGPSSALTTSSFSTPPKDRNKEDRGREQDREPEIRRREWESDDPKFTVHDLETLTSQLSGLTSIANSLQREMTNLSRRSKDNATDLISLKEATKSRDEDIRTSLRELVHSLRILESDRLLEGPGSSVPMITQGSASSRSSSYASDLASSKLSSSSKTSSIDPKSGAEMAALDRILKDMPTKEEQGRVISLLQEVQEALKSRISKSESEEKVLSLLEEFKDREYARGKELAIPGKLADSAEGKIMSMLEDLRDDLHETKPKEVDRRVLFMLEEIKQKDNEDEERIFSVLEDLKNKEGDERIETVLSLLHELKEQGGDAKVLSFLEDIKKRIDAMSEELSKAVNGIKSQPTSQPETSKATTDHPVESDGFIDILNSVKEGVDSGGDTMAEVKKLLEDWKGLKGGQEREAQETLKDLMKEIEVLVTEQRHAIARLHNSSGLPSTALTFNPPLPPDLDNEAAITALANIASTTTRTDITLSSINALIKVFQKDVNHANTHSAESLLSVSRFLDDLQESMAGTNSQAGEIRKIIEVIRIGVGGANDKLAQFDGSFTQKIEELLHIQKHLQRKMLGNEDEYIWKQDVGVKASVEELRSEVEDMMERNIEAVNEAAEKTAEAINNANTAPLIAELKIALGAMAERSLQAFKDADPTDALDKLKTDLTEAILNTNSAEAIQLFRTEVKELLEKSLTAIDSKSGSDEVTELLAGMKQELGELVEKSSTSSMTESAEVKLAIQTLKSEVEEMLQKSLNSAITISSSTADDKTSAAIAELKSEVGDMMSKAVAIADKPDGSEKIQKSIEALKREITDLMDKYTTAIAPPTTYPEAEEIKARIAALSNELCEAMERTVALASESSTESNQKVKKTVEDLRSDIGELGKSMAAAVTSNSASSVEEAMKCAFEAMRSEVLGKIEKGLGMSEAANDKMAAAIEDLKKEVNEAVENSISLAVAAVPEPDMEPINKVHKALEGLREQISDVMDKSLISAAGGSDNIKSIVEGLRKEVAEMMEKSMSMLAPSGSEEATKVLLTDIKKDITEILEKTPSLSESSAIKDAVDQLRKEVSEMLEKSIPITAAKGTDADTPPDPGTIERIESSISDLKTEICEMVERSLAAAIANSTFDSEENVKEVIEELKKDVRDILQMSIVPLAPPKEDAIELIKIALAGFKHDLGMFTADGVAPSRPSADVAEAIAELKTQVCEMMERSKDDEIRGALEALRMQVKDFSVLQGSSGDDEKEVVEALRKEVQSLVERFGVVAGEVRTVVEDLQKKESGQLQIARESYDGEVKEAIDALKTQVEELEIQGSMNALKAQIEELSEKSKDKEIKEAIETLKKDIEESMDRSMSALVIPTSTDAPIIKQMIDTLKKELVESMRRGFESVKDNDAIRELTEAVRTLMERPVRFGGSDVGSDTGFEKPEFNRSQTEYRAADKAGDKADKLKVAVDVLRKEFLEMMEKFSGIVSTSVSAPDSEQAKGIEGMKNAAYEVKQATAEVKRALAGLAHGQADEKEAIADLDSAVGECRVEVAVVKTLVEEKNGEVRAGLAGVSKIVHESRIELKDSVAGVKDNIEILRTVTTEGIVGVSSMVSEFQSEAKEGIAGVSSSISEFQAETRESITDVATAVKEFQSELKGDIAEVQDAVSGVQLETIEGISSVNKIVSDFQVETKEGISGVKEAVEIAQTGVRESVEEVKKAVEGSHVEVKEAVVDIAAKVEASTTGIKATIEESHRKTHENFTSVSAAVEGYSVEVKEDIFAVKKAVEESHTNAADEHHRTQKQVKEVIGLVDMLQMEWKGSQPTLFNALMELKHLLRDAQEEIAKKPDSIPPPPAYDDSQTQEKLNILLAAETRTAKHLPQLDLLDTIKDQVSATSADIAEFLTMQKEVLLEDATTKIDAARQAEADLEKANTEKKLVEAATAALRDEHANLQDSIDTLKDETEALNARKLKLTADVAGLETALDLRRDELLLLEARAEGLERRVIEGVIEQSRALLSKPRSSNSRLSKVGAEAARMKVKHGSVPRASAAPGRRHLSLNEIDSPPGSNKLTNRPSLSGATLGLGQHEYSASLGLLTRSQSTRSVRGTRKSSWNQKNSSGRTASGNNERGLTVKEEETGDLDVDEGADDVDMGRDLAEEEDEIQSGFDEGRRSSSGSVRRLAADEDDNFEGSPSMKRRSKNYPALGLDFSGDGLDRRDMSGQRSASGFSTGP